MYARPREEKQYARHFEMMLRSIGKDAPFRRKGCSIIPSKDAPYPRYGASFPIPRHIFSDAAEHLFRLI